MRCRGWPPERGTQDKADHPALPVTIAETVACAKACFEAGHRPCIFTFVMKIRPIFWMPGCIVRRWQNWLPCGAGDAFADNHGNDWHLCSRDMRAVVRAVQPPGVSIGVAEMIPDYQPDRETIRFYQELAETPARLQHICYRPEDVQLLARLLQMAGLAGDDIWCLLCWGSIRAAATSRNRCPLFWRLHRLAGWRPDWADLCPLCPRGTGLSGSSCAKRRQDSGRVWKTPCICRMALWLRIMPPGCGTASQLFKS